MDTEGDSTQVQECGGGARACGPAWQEVDPAMRPVTYIPATWAWGRSRAREARSGHGDGRPAGALQTGVVGPRLVTPPNRNGQQQGTGAQVHPPCVRRAHTLQGPGRKREPELQGSRAPGTAVPVPPTPASRDQAGIPAGRERSQPRPPLGAHRIL